MPAIKIRDMTGTRTIEAELLTDYKREKRIRRCVVSVVGGNSNMPLESTQNQEEFEKAVYEWLLEGGRRFVARPIEAKAIVDCEAYKDPENADRTIYEITYVWEDKKKT